MSLASVLELHSMAISACGKYTRHRVLFLDVVTAAGLLVGNGSRHGTKRRFPRERSRRDAINCS